MQRSMDQLIIFIDIYNRLFFHQNITISRNYVSLTSEHEVYFQSITLNVFIKNIVVEKTLN